MNFLVIEDGEPTYVVLTVEEFKKLKNGKENEETCCLKDIALEDDEIVKEDSFDWLPDTPGEEKAETAFGAVPEEKTGFEIPEEFLMDDGGDKKEELKEGIRIEDLPF